MAQAANIHSVLGTAANVGGLNQIKNPGAGGTFDLLGKSDAWVTVGAGTYYLPDNMGLGTKLNVYATGAVILRSKAPVTAATLASGETACCTATSATTWVGDVQTTGLKTTKTDRAVVPITSVLKQDGTVMAAQASTTTGFSQLSNKNIVIHIPANSTAESFSFSTALPRDADVESAVTVYVSTTKSADDDALTLDLELYSFAYESGWGSDLYAGSALSVGDDGSAQNYSCSAPNAYHLAGVLTLGGTNDSDVTYIHTIEVEYTRNVYV